MLQIVDIKKIKTAKILLKLISSCSNFKYTGLTYTSRLHSNNIYFRIKLMTYLSLKLAKHIEDFHEETLKFQ